MFGASLILVEIQDAGINVIDKTLTGSEESAQYRLLCIMNMYLFAYVAPFIQFTSEETMDQLFLTIEANITYQGASTDSLFIASKKLLKIIYDSN